MQLTRFKLYSNNTNKNTSLGNLYVANIFKFITLNYYMTTNTGLYLLGYTRIRHMFTLCIYNYILLLSIKSSIYKKRCINTFHELQNRFSYCLETEMRKII